jgi:hypothetical protein
MPYIPIGTVLAAVKGVMELIAFLKTVKDLDSADKQAILDMINKAKEIPKEWKDEQIG